MLVLKGITKDYQAGDTTVHALKGLDLCFRQSEFVAVLGPSGCGKTTLLNIVGGLDRYTQGDLRIGGKSTVDFTDGDWDSYRNHSIGFVFQTYNLIPHQTVLRNVELALTLSGVGKSERRRRAAEALEKVGLGDQLHKKPNQMSGGQMQRVAIARALVNDPEILLADEPTGALDTETSVQIMEILKEISHDRLIIMVTHNPELAERYATRTVRLLDGTVLDDTDPYSPEEEAKEASGKAAGRQKKPAMSFATALSLSLNNLMTKKARTILTAFAGSIGIIGIALILSLSNGIQNYIDRVQEDALSTYPLTITSETMDMSSMISSMASSSSGTVQHELDAVYSNTILSDLADNMLNMSFRSNDLTSLLNWLDSEESGAKQYISGISLDYNSTLQIYGEPQDGKLYQVNPSPVMDSLMGTFYNADTLSNLGSFGEMFSSGMDIWQELLNNEELMQTQYDVIAGRWPQQYDEVVLIVDPNNEINDIYLYSLGIKDPKEMEEQLSATLSGEKLNATVQSWTYDELLSKTFRLVLPTDCFRYDESGDRWEDMRQDEDYMYQVVSDALPLRVVGIIRPSEHASAAAISGAVGYLSELTTYYLDSISESAIVQQQLGDESRDVISGLPFDDGSTPEPADSEKAAGFLSWVSGLSNLDKANLYTAIASTPSEEDILAMAQASLEGYSQEALLEMVVAAAAEQMGMPADAVRGYVSNMSEEELRAQVLQAMVEQLTAGYAASAEAGLGSLSTEELTGMLEMQLSITDEAGLAAYYDRFVPPPFSSGTCKGNLNLLGYNDRSQPSTVNLYCATFEDKDELVALINQYNRDMEASGQEDKVINFTDYVGLLMSSVTAIINAISYVLVAFVSISLVVSSIMIGIITYISVLERTKEIGILRSIGASKRDVARVFNAETLIVGFTAGFIGILLTVLLNIPISLIVQKLTDIPYLRSLLPGAAGVVLVIISMALTLIAGIIPSRVAAKKDPVVALRTE